MGFGAIISAALGFFLRSVVAKFFIFFGLFFITTEFISVLSSAGILPNASSMNGVLGGVPAGVWYFLDLFNFSMGISSVVSAMATRFIIRRIPVIG